MDEFFRRRRKSKGLALFMMIALIIGILLIVGGFVFLSYVPELQR